MSTSAFQEIISADSADRADLFLTTVWRLGTPLINRFSEDIDVTVFRDVLGHPAGTAEISTLPNKMRKAALEAIAADSSRYMLCSVSKALAPTPEGKGASWRFRKEEIDSWIEQQDNQIKMRGEGNL